jgi:hypothetical protein
MTLSQPDLPKSSYQYIRFLAKPKHVYTFYTKPDRPIALPYEEVGNLNSTRDAVMVDIKEFKKNEFYKEGDTDSDGIVDSKDNCPNVANPGQENENSDQMGDACEDSDYDGVMNILDNCIYDPNSNQKDTDGDKVGDACDKEESRLTEKYPWVPLFGIGFAFVVLAGLFFTVLRTPTKQES